MRRKERRKGCRVKEGRQGGRKEGEMESDREKGEGARRERGMVRKGKGDRGKGGKGFGEKEVDARRKGLFLIAFRIFLLILFSLLSQSYI